MSNRGRDNSTEQRGRRFTAFVAVVVLVSLTVLLVTFPYSRENLLPQLLLIALALGVQYLLIVFLFVARERDNTIRLMDYGKVVSDTETAPQEMEKITLFGDDGLMKLSVNLKNLFFIESDDNYIKVWYNDAGGKVKQYMLRCRLKTVEDSFQNSHLTRCHRKYIVNLSRAQSISREKDGYYITLDIPEADPIPISKTYEDTVISRFNSR